MRRGAVFLATIIASVIGTLVMGLAANVPYAQAPGMGLTSVVVAVCFALSAFLASVVSAIPSAATAPALVIVGVMMMSSFREIDWTELSEAIPAFFAGVFMALCYSISYGIAAGFFFYCLVKICKKQAKEIHPIIWVSTALFVLNFILTAAM